MKGDVKSEAEKENQKEEEDIDLTPHEHERVSKGAYRIFVITSAPKTDFYSYFNQTKPHIKALIKNQLRTKKMSKTQRATRMIRGGLRLV